MNSLNLINYKMGYSRKPISDNEQMYAMFAMFILALCVVIYFLCTNL